MKTSESVRIYIGIFGRLFGSSWTGTNCSVLHLVCFLPACTHCHWKKAEQIRQQTLSLLNSAGSRQVLLAGSQSTDTEINKPQQFVFMLKFQHNKLYSDDFFSCSLFSFIAWACLPQSQATCCAEPWVRAESAIYWNPHLPVLLPANLQHSFKRHKIQKDISHLLYLLYPSTLF